MFLKMIDGVLQPYSMWQLQLDNPNTSFPPTLSQEIMARYGLQHAPANTATKPEQAETEETAREKRNALLTACDWTQIPDAQLEPEARQAWVEYRQLLRDVPTQAGFPTNVIWPAAPKAASTF